MHRLQRKVSTIESRSDSITHARNIYTSLQKIVQLMTDIGPHEFIGDLSISMASLERLLVIYFQGLLLQRPGARLDAYHYGAVLEDLERSIDEIEADSQLHKPRGGMVTLLYLTSLALGDLHETLEGFKLGFLPAIVSSPLFWAYSFLRFADIYVVNDAIARGRSVQVSHDYPSYSSSLTPLVEPRDIPYFYSSLFGRDSGKFAIIAGVSLAAGAVSSYSFRQMYYRNWLATHRDRIAVVLRQWTLALYTVFYTQMQVTSSPSPSLTRIPSQSLLVAQHNDDDAKHATEVLARRVLFNSPPPSSVAWWFDRHLSLHLFKRAIDVFYASTGSSYQWIKWAFGEGSFVWRSFGLMFSTWFVPYYLLNSTAASYKAAEILANPTMDFLDQSWKVLEMNSLRPLTSMLLKLKGDLGLERRMVIANVPCVLVNYSKTIDCDGLIFFCHGGGFFKHMANSDLAYLLIWSRVSKCPVLIPEYSLVPHVSYPTAIIELFSVYKQVASSSMQHLGYNVRRTCVVGESAGGNLAASLVNRIIMTNLKEYRSFVRNNEMLGPIPQHGLLEVIEEEKVVDSGSRAAPDVDAECVPIPTCLFLAYPGLNLCVSPSPSRSVLVADPILPIGVTTLIAKEYHGPNISNPSEYPCLSPAHTPHDILGMYPRTLLSVGSFDPLLDDAEDYYERLKRNSRNETYLEVHNDYPHGYLGLHRLLENGVKVMESHAEWMIKHMN